MDGQFVNRSGRPAAAVRVPLRELAERLDAELVGDGGVTITGVGGLEDASAGDLIRVDSGRFLETALASPAAAMLVGHDLPITDRPTLRVRDPRIAFARALELFYPERRPTPGVDPTARLGAGVTLGEGCSVGAYAVLGAGATLGARVVVHPFVYLGEQVQVGDESVLFPHVTVYERVALGRRVRVHSGTVIGADGFGYQPGPDSLLKIPQIGTVVIEDDVEIGANSGVDRATTGVTRVGAGTKLDNMVQVGHNVQIGRNCRIMALVGIAGSCVIEDEVTIAGMAGFRDHVRVGRRSMVAGQSGVWGDVPAGVVVSGGPARPHREELRRLAEVARLPATNERLRALERRLQELEARLPSK